MTEPRYMYFLAHTGRDTERAKELRNFLHPDVPVFGPVWYANGTAIVRLI